MEMILCTAAKDIEQSIAERAPVAFEVQVQQEHSMLRDGYIHSIQLYPLRITFHEFIWFPTGTILN